MSEINQQQKEALGRMMVEGFKKGDPEIVEGCLKRGANPDVLVQDGDSGVKRPVLHWAAQYFNAAGMQAMLEHGANIEAHDTNGNTALIFAISNFKEEAVDFLMKNGADPLAQNRDGIVALDAARALRTDYESYQQSRDRIIKALTKDYDRAQPEPQPQPETPPPPVTFDQKPKGHKFSV